MTTRGRATGWRITYGFAAITLAWTIAVVANSPNAEPSVAWLTLLCVTIISLLINMSLLPKQPEICERTNGFGWEGDYPDCGECEACRNNVSRLEECEIESQSSWMDWGDCGECPACLRNAERVSQNKSAQS